LLQPGQVIELPEKLRVDLQFFVQSVIALDRPEQLQAMRRVADAYALNV